MSIDVDALARELEGLSPLSVIKRALAEQGEALAISFSGAEDVLLLEYARQAELPFRVFSLDTGRLHPQTYRYFRDVEKHYDLRIEYCFPEADDVQALVRAKGLFSFYEDGHGECCGVRKVAPLRRQLATLEGWVTGQRRDQSPGTRTQVPVVQVDEAHAGRGGGRLIKWNPLAGMSSDEVWDAIRAFGVPYNPLHERGMVSIGCEPCTRAILPGQHEREGRWWWEREDSKECGLHSINVDPEP